jgi:DNA-binding Xre family transcriptional regulator
MTIAISAAALWKNAACLARFAGTANYWFSKMCQWVFAVNAGKNSFVLKLQRRLMPRWSRQNAQAAFCKCLCINIKVGDKLDPIRSRVRNLKIISRDAVGISKPYLSQIETGKRKGSTDILSALAKALNVTLEEVIAREAK